MDKKVCTKCGEEKELGCFTRCSHNKDGLNYHCKPCINKHRRENRHRYKDQSDNWREHHYQKSYGISLATYNDLLYLQSSGCAICGWTMTDTSRRLCVDHDHKTGAVRQLLCNMCNVVLGQINDNKDTLYGMIEYLERHSNDGES